MAPEILDSNPRYNNKIDIWALVSIIYEICTFKFCFDCNNFKGLYNLIKNEKHDKINLKYYSSELQDLIDLLLKKNYKERPDINKVYDIVLNYRRKFILDNINLKDILNNKNEIRIIIKINNNDSDKEIDFWDSTLYLQNVGKKYVRDNLNKSKEELKTDGNIYKFKKCFRFSEGQDNIKLKINLLIKDGFGMTFKFENISNIDLSMFNKINNYKMSYMFLCGDNLININLSSANSSNAININNMFFFNNDNNKFKRNFPLFCYSFFQKQNINKIMELLIKIFRKHYFNCIFNYLKKKALLIRIMTKLYRNKINIIKAAFYRYKNIAIFLKLFEKATQYSNEKEKIKEHHNNEIKNKSLEKKNNIKILNLFLITFQVLI